MSKAADLYLPTDDDSDDPVIVPISDDGYARFREAESGALVELSAEDLEHIIDLIRQHDES